MAFACNNMRILPAEAFNAVTINGACALEIGHSHGSIAKGKSANLIITKPIPLTELYGVFFWEQSCGQSHFERKIE